MDRRPRGARLLKETKNGRNEIKKKHDALYPYRGKRDKETMMQGKLFLYKKLNAATEETLKER